ncbi:LysE family translocator [Celeribacter baekdonensis]|uniref:MFS transporter n=1 Tax=Celeribacter baekdonensis TaxID=875171 RepID=A0A2R4M3L1_9RHOB|nr:LysE family translocator [Celeribacter baekdonensis]AVW91771.1 MFS transporter [Celeribacter baekdonensis]
MDHTLITFVLIAGLLVMSPGPNGVLIAKTVPMSGRAAGFANVAGFVTAFYLHGALSILGISVILVHSALAFSIVKLLGAAYLIWLGAKALIAAYRGKIPDAEPSCGTPKKHLLNAYLEGLLTNVLNPKVSMFYLAAFPQFIPQDAGTAGSAFLLVFLHSMINLIWFGGMVMLFAKLSRVARGARVQRWLKGVTGVVLIGFGARLAR